MGDSSGLRPMQVITWFLEIEKYSKAYNFSWEYCAICHGKIEDGGSGWAYICRGCHDDVAYGRKQCIAFWIQALHDEMYEMR